MMNNAKKLVVNYYAKLGTVITEGDVYVVWFCKTLQNHKVLLSTPLHDTRYFEVTYNGDKGETYVDTYVKENNTCVPDKEVLI